MFKANLQKISSFVPKKMQFPPREVFCVERLISTNMDSGRETVPVLSPSLINTYSISGGLVNKKKCKNVKTGIWICFTERTK